MIINWNSYSAFRFLENRITKLYCHQNSNYTSWRKNLPLKTLKLSPFKNVDNDYTFSFDVIKLFISIPAPDVLNIIKNLLLNDPTLVEHTKLFPVDIMSAPKLCLHSVILRFKNVLFDKFSRSCEFLHFTYGCQYLHGACLMPSPYLLLSTSRNMNTILWRHFLYYTQLDN